MIKSQIKIIVSASTGAYVTDIKTQEIENLEDTKFSANLWGGQGEVWLQLKTQYDNLTYTENQFVEIAFYNEDNKTWFLQYSWFIKNINRNYSQQNSDSVDIEILGLGSILWEHNGTFVFSGTLVAGINAFIAQFHAVYNISSTMEFIGSSLFKNGITDTTAINVNITWTYFDILKWIFDSITKTFVINKIWTIYLGDQSIVEHMLAINKDIIDMKISSSRETNITLTWNTYDITPGDKIFIQNINSAFNMDWSRIEKVEVGLLETRIYLWNIWSLWTDILKP